MKVDKDFKHHIDVSPDEYKAYMANINRGDRITLLISTRDKVRYYRLCRIKGTTACRHLHDLIQVELRNNKALLDAEGV